MSESSQFTPIEAGSPHADDHLSFSKDLLEESERQFFLEKTDQLVAEFGLLPESGPVVSEGLVQALYAIALDERGANAASEAFDMGDAGGLGREWGKEHRRRMRILGASLRNAIAALELSDRNVPPYLHASIFSRELGGEEVLARDLEVIRRVAAAADRESRARCGRPTERRDGWREAIDCLRSAWRHARPPRRIANFGDDRRLSFITDALRWLVRDVLEDPHEFVTPAIVDDVLHNRRRALR